MSYKERIEDTAELERLLRDYKNPGVESSMLKPYEGVSEEQQADLPIIFCHGFAWTEKSKAERQGWQGMRTGHGIALERTYPGCGKAYTEVDLEKADHWPVVAAQVYAKQRRSIRGNIAFLDIDVVAFRKAELFEGDFDIGLTDSQEFWPVMPFNAGVMFAKDTQGAQLFLDRAMEYAATIPGNMPTWYTYQLAIGLAYRLLKDEVKIKLFPKELYNYAPDDFDPNTPAYFVHCKGARKMLFTSYVRDVIERAACAPSKV